MGHGVVLSHPGEKSRGEAAAAAEQKVRRGRRAGIRKLPGRYASIQGVLCHQTIRCPLATCFATSAKQQLSKRTYGSCPVAIQTSRASFSIRCALPDVLCQQTIRCPFATYLPSYLPRQQSNSYQHERLFDPFRAAPRQQREHMKYFSSNSNLK